MKYGNQKVRTQVGVFDSKSEFKDWCKLKLLEKAGEIKELQRQVTFELLPTIKTNVETLRRVVYIVDFLFYDVGKGCYVAMDTKGFKTSVYNLKKRLFLAKFPKIVFIENGKTCKIYEAR